MSIQISSWDSIQTSCGEKPCFFFKPTMALSSSLLDNTEPTTPVRIGGTSLYDGVHRISFDKANTDKLMYIGIVENAFTGIPQNTGNFLLKKGN